jgi:regulator of sirC expression with transglutaminase-like and TPR domain
MHPIPLFNLRFWPLLCLLFASATSVAPASSGLSSVTADPNFQTIKAILELPEQRIDLARVKLTIDKMIDPGVDIEKDTKQLDEMAAEIKAKLPFAADSQTKLDVLRAAIYKPNSINGFKAFGYDLDDPLGQKMRNSLLSNYLATRKGNCISMPFLFIVLGQKLGLDVTASTAPMHVFVKYRDDRGNLQNIETTSGANFARDEWMQQQNPMTQKSLDNGAYLQYLSKKETVVVMATTLLEFYKVQGLYERIIPLSSFLVNYYPKHIPLMLLNCESSDRLVQELVWKYNSPKNIPYPENLHYTQLYKGFLYWAKRADALGWEPVSEETMKTYKQSVNNAKSSL